MKQIFLAFTLITIFYSCKDKAKSDFADIEEVKFIETQLPIKSVGIDNTEGEIYFFVDKELKNSDLPITIKVDIKLSAGANLSTATNQLDFNTANDVKQIKVTAENGKEKEWFIYLVHHQIQNSDFKIWFDNKGMNNKKYKEIGSSTKKSVWGTANIGTSMYDVYCTKKAEKGVEITTGYTNIVPITAGTLFTGSFNLDAAVKNPTNPKKATKFGTPFIFKPKKIRIKYQYTPGKKLIQATLKDPNSLFGGFTQKEIEGEDECDVYAYLEKRTKDNIIKIAEAYLQDGKKTDGLVEKHIEFKQITDDTPTHITIVFTSGKNADKWRGAVGSKLLVEEFELIY